VSRAVPSTLRRAAGAASKRAGEAWEQHVSSQWLEPLRKAGVLRCWHKLEPRKVGDRFVADAGADFVACLSSGEYVAIECKQTTKQRFPRSAISAVQEAHLDAVPRSFLALLIEGRRFLIPWRKVPWVTLLSAESVTAADCAIWELKPGQGLQALVLRLEG
jgi:hypothetical protein